jgi:hypothetical protein
MPQFREDLNGQNRRREKTSKQRPSNELEVLKPTVPRRIWGTQKGQAVAHSSTAGSNDFARATVLQTVVPFVSATRPLTTFRNELLIPRASVYSPPETAEPPHLSAKSYPSIRKTWRGAARNLWVAGIYSSHALRAAP